MDETIEILDEQCVFTGKPCLKSTAHKLGIRHASIQVWLYKSNGEVLIQKRSMTKETHPGLWDVSIAGHIAFGETPLSAAIRESKEELGLHLYEQKMILIHKHLQKDTHLNGIIDDEFNFIYGYLLSENDMNFRLQKSEVAAIKWIKIEKLQKAIDEKNPHFVNRKPSYYPPIFRHFKTI